MIAVSWSVPVFAIDYTGTSVPRPSQFTPDDDLLWLSLLLAGQPTSCQVHLAVHPSRLQTLL
jgi:hypothetical protein